MKEEAGMESKMDEKSEIRKLLTLSPKAVDLIAELKLNHLSRHLISHPESYKMLKTAHLYHKDQVDKSGVDYIVHLVHTTDIALKNKSKFKMSGVPDSVVVQATLFHDFEEDEEPRAVMNTYNETPEDVYHAMKFDERAVKAIKSVSRKEDETYNEFIERVIRDGKDNPLTRLVKYSDILSNTCEKRKALIVGVKASESLDKRYKKALNKIENSVFPSSGFSL